MGVRCGMLTTAVMFLAGCAPRTDVEVPTGRPAAVVRVFKSPAQDAAEFQTAGSLRECPLGHAVLRDVPVVSGLPLRGGNLRERIDRGEIIFEGCVGSGRPHHVVCQACRYTYEEATESWERSVTNPRDLRVPLNQSVAAFPTDRGQSVSYRQQLRADGVCGEEVHYRSPAAAADIEGRIVAFMTAFGWTPERSSRPGSDGESVRLWFEDGRLRFAAAINPADDGALRSVSFGWRLNEDRRERRLWGRVLNGSERRTSDP